MPNPFNTRGIQNNSRPNMADIYKQMINSKNPMQLFNNIANSNPNIASIAKLLNNGAKPKEVFNMLCQQRGINPQDFINNLTK